MSDRNGTTHPPAGDTRRQLREQRAANALIVEQMKGNRLKRAKDRMEATYDWVTPYVDLVDRARKDPAFAGPAGAWMRRYGRNYPIYQTEQELGAYRAGARVLLATNSYAIGLQEGLCSYVIGQGFTYRSTAKPTTKVPDGLVDACQSAIDEFMQREQWYGGEQPGLEEELFNRSCEDGEWFLDHTCDESGYTTVRTVEPEQVTKPPDGDPLDYSFGVRTARNDVQKPLGYFVFWGDNPSEGEEIRPDDLIHLRRNVKRSMKRGMTDYCFDMYDSLELSSRLRTNMTDAAAQQAAIVGVREHATASKDDIQAFVDGEADFTAADGRGASATGAQVPNRYYDRGRWEDVAEGLKYVPGPIAGNAPIHIQILQACLRGACVKWNAFEWLGSADASNNSYANALSAESPFSRRVIRVQRPCREAHKRTMLIVLRNRAEAGTLIAAGRAWSWDEVQALIEVQVEAPSPVVRNKLEETQRAAIEIPLSVDSRQRYCQEQGRDYDQIAQDNEEFMDETGGTGGILPIPGMPGVPGANPPTATPTVTGKGPATLPDIRQRSNFDCGPAAMRSILAHYGIERTQEELIQDLGTTVADGTDLARITDYADACGLQVARYSRATIDDLRRLTAWGWPCLVPIQSSGSSRVDQEQLAAGHYVVVTAVEGDSVIYQDPLAGPRRLNVHEFANLWYDRDADGTAHRRVIAAIGPPQQ